MSPLLPLRIILLGSFSWIIIGVGLYCLWEGYKRANTPTYVDTIELRESDDLTVDNPTTPTQLRHNRLILRRHPQWSKIQEGLGLTFFAVQSCPCGASSVSSYEVLTVLRFCPHNRRRGRSKSASGWRRWLTSSRTSIRSCFCADIAVHSWLELRSFGLELRG